MAEKKWTQRFGWVFLLVGVLSLFLVWYLISFSLQSRGNMVLPYPHDTFARAAALLFGANAGYTWRGIGWTSLRLLIGFGVSFVLGAILGTLGGLFDPVRKFMIPWVAFHKTVPTAAVVMVLIGILFGPKNRALLTYAPCYLTFLVAFPIIYEAFVKGIQEEDSDVLDVLNLEGGSRRFQSVTRVLLPDAFPYVTLAVTQSLGLSLKVSIMSEILTANSVSKLGIGGLISMANTNGETENIVAYALITLVLMIIIDIPFVVVKYRSKRK